MLRAFHEGVMSRFLGAALFGAVGGAMATPMLNGLYPPQVELRVVDDTCPAELERARTTAFAAVMLQQETINAYVLLAEEALRDPTSMVEASRIYGSDDIVLLMDPDSVCASFPEEDVPACLFNDPKTLVFAWGTTDDGVHLNYQMNLETVFGTMPLMEAPQESFTTPSASNTTY